MTFHIQFGFSHVCCFNLFIQFPCPSVKIKSCSGGHLEYLICMKKNLLLRHHCNDYSCKVCIQSSLLFLRNLIYFPIRSRRNNCRGDHLVFLIHVKMSVFKGRSNDHSCAVWFNHLCRF